MQRYFPGEMLWSVIGICLIIMIAVSCMSASSSPNISLFAPPTARYDGHTWSPDGRWLASESTDASKLSLFSANGFLVNELHLGCELGTGVGDFSWLPDGRISCFRANEANRKLDVFILDQKGHAKRNTTISIPTTPYALISTLEWNPQQFWLTVIADKRPGEVSPYLYIFDLQGHNLISPMSTDAEELTWSPDGRQLALVEPNGDIRLLSVEQTAAGKLTVTSPRQLSAGTDSLENVAWSPSGHWLVCRHVSYQSEDYLFLLATDGSGKQVKLTSSTTDGQLDYPAWSPDGKQLIVGRVADGALLSLNIVKVLKEKGIEP